MSEAPKSLMKWLFIVSLVFGYPSSVLGIGGKTKNINGIEENTELVLCTMDAKLCPDGSYVSRVGPNCKFTPCPSEMLSLEEEFIDATIIGSAEAPDPVLERILELKRQGAISNVIIMESFPVQIQLKATQKTIAELEAMPRVKSPTFQ